MKKIVSIFAIMLFWNFVYSQDTINHYNTENLVGETFTNPAPTGYYGEYQIYINYMYWFTTGNLPADNLITYSFECVSFPFVPDCFDINSGSSSCTPGEPTEVDKRNFIVLPDNERNYNISVPYNGIGWSDPEGKTVYQMSDPHIFYVDWMSYPATLASNAYSTNDWYYDRMILPHSILRITLNVHNGNSIDSTIVVKISWLYDNTRGRMQKYPFIFNNGGTNEEIKYDVIFIPKFVYDTPHYYYTTSNIDWFQGAHPVGMTPQGSINYYHADDIDPEYIGYPYYPPEGSYDTGFPPGELEFLYFYPAPYVLLTPPLRNAYGKAYAGFDDNGDTTTAVQEGIPHTYVINDTIDLNLINPTEKIIYNPSRVEIDCNLIFPADYKFLTVHGKYPDSAWVEENNPDGIVDRRQVLCPSDQIDEEGVFLSEYYIDNKTLTIDQGVTIMDAKFTGEGTINYYPDNFSGNFIFDPDLNLNLYSESFYINDPDRVLANVTDFHVSYLYIQPGASLTIQNSLTAPMLNTVYIEPGASLTINNTFTAPTLNTVYIEPGATLTIQNTLTVSAETKIIVKRGAQLIIDGGKITRNGLWQGIELWGTSTQPQTLEYQGLVEVKNGGIIENAVCGIRAVKMDTPSEGNDVPNLNYTGGIIKTKNAVFRNNKTAVRIYDYSTENSASHFKNTDFIAYSNSPVNLLHLSGIDGISILGCTFEDQRTSLNITQRATGIYATNAMFNVNEYCIVNGNCYPSVFTGLNYGINTITYNPLKVASIKNSNFEENHRSVYLSTMDGATVVFNQFTPYTGITMNGEDSYCLYLDYCTEYTVEENSFEHGSTGPGGLGMVINNSGSDNNEIYNNTFTNLDYATLAQNCNRSSDPDIGLVIKCNDYWDNYQDIAVTSEEEIEYPGIARDQGAEGGGTDAQAGNRFSLNNNGNGISDYSSFKQGPINYYHHNPVGEPRVKPDYYTEKFINLEEQLNQYDEGVSCPSNQSGGGGSDEDGLKGEMAESEYKADSTQAILTALVDGGNSEILEQEVLQSMPPEAYDLYMSLMGKSPYLSDSVLMAAIEKENVLPNVLIKDILVANPQAAKSNEVMEKVDEKSNPMTEEMIAEILLGKYFVAAKEKLEANVAYYRHQRSTALKFLKQLYRNDTANAWAQDSLIFLLENEQGLKEKFELVFAYTGQDNWTAAMSLLNNLPAQYSFNTYRQEMYDDYSQLINVYYELYQAGFGIDSLSESQKSALYLLADNVTNMAGGYARNILIEVDSLEYSEPIILPDAGLKSGSIVFDLPGIENFKPEYVKLYPNPAKDFIIVELLTGNIDGVNIEVYDIQGKYLFAKEIPGKKQHCILPIKKLKTGIYYLKVEMGNRPIKSKKFSVVK